MLLFLAVYWPVALSRQRFPAGMRQFLTCYVVWLMLMVSVGLIAFIVQWSPIYFLLSGVRWLILLHASLGLFVLARNMPREPAVQNRLLVLLGVLAVVDAYVALRQFSLGVTLKEIAFAAGRLTGVFSNAGVAGTFGVALAIFALILDRASTPGRIGLIALAMFIAVSSGTRSAMVSIAIVAALVSWELVSLRLARATKQLLVVLAVPVAIAALVGGYFVMVDAVGRGDMFAEQLNEGGRVANFMLALSDFSIADPGEMLVGRGLGIATNTAISYQIVQGIDPSQFRFNRLIDNTFVTLTFQTGVLGLVLFVAGALAFFRFVRPGPVAYARARYRALLVITLMMLFGGNLLEQYFLLTTLFIAFGDLYGKFGQNEAHVYSEEFSREILTRS
ncbi:hypothetical protein [Paraburkholderia ribeironis]|uniref:hypothetical protein n=1 Tax=Paraburkholderia ribeironis TaxID=1247936 RepID=UPI001177A58A|nr:hypothetical protein [Paraburkholderia ribeironis]